MVDQNIKMTLLFPLVVCLLNCIVLLLKGKNKVSGELAFFGIAASFVSVCLMLPTIINEGQVLVNLGSWMRLDSFSFNIELLVDELSFVLSFVLTFVGSFLLLYLIGFKRDLPDIDKFFTFFPAFIFFMLVFALSGNFLILLVGNAGAGILIYIVVNCHLADHKKIEEGSSIFILNIFADICVFVGIIGFAIMFGTMSFVGLENHFKVDHLEVLSFISVTLGVVIKLINLPNSVFWPNLFLNEDQNIRKQESILTYVALIIYVASMAFSGIFILLRISNIIVDFGEWFDYVSWIGLIISLMAVFFSITKKNLSKIIVYIVLSQMGLILFSLGVGAFASAMVFMVSSVLVSTLFLMIAGIIAYNGENCQNVFEIYDLSKKMPIAFICFLVGFLSISGIPLFADFFIRSNILWVGLNHLKFGVYFYSISLMITFLLVFSMSRLGILIFLRKGTNEITLHKIPKPSLVAICSMTLATVVCGFLAMPNMFSESFGRVFHGFIDKRVPDVSTSVYGSGLELVFIILLVAGGCMMIALAYFVYLRKGNENIADLLRDKFSVMWTLSNNDCYLKEGLASVVIKPFFRLAGFIDRFVDRYLLGFFVALFAFMFVKSGRLLFRDRSSKLEENLLFIVIGTSICIILVMGILVFNKPV